MGYGATAARLTPDQKVGSSNLSGLIIWLGLGFRAGITGFELQMGVVLDNVFDCDSDVAQECVARCSVTAVLSWTTSSTATVMLHRSAWYVAW